MVPGMSNDFPPLRRSAVVRQLRGYAADVDAIRGDDEIVFGDDGRLALLMNAIGNLADRIEKGGVR